MEFGLSKLTMYICMEVQKRWKEHIFYFSINFDFGFMDSWVHGFMIEMQMWAAHEDDDDDKSLNAMLLDKFATKYWSRPRCEGGAWRL